MNVGQNNFDHIRFEYFSDRNVAFEAFKAGTFTTHEEFTAAIWAKGYDFPAFTEGRVKREEIPDAQYFGHSGLVLQHAPSRISPIRKCGRRSATPSTSCGPTPT